MGLVESCHRRLKSAWFPAYDRGFRRCQLDGRGGRVHTRRSVVMPAVAVTVPGYAFPRYSLETGVKVEAGDGSECLPAVAERDQPVRPRVLGRDLGPQNLPLFRCQIALARPAPEVRSCAVATIANTANCMKCNCSYWSKPHPVWTCARRVLSGPPTMGSGHCRWTARPRPPPHTGAGPPAGRRPGLAFRLRVPPAPGRGPRPDG